MESERGEREKSEPETWEPSLLGTYSSLGRPPPCPQLHENWSVLSRVLSQHLKIELIHLTIHP